VPARSGGRRAATVTAYLLSSALTFTAIGLVVAWHDVAEKERRIAELEAESAAVQRRRDVVEQRLVRTIQDLEAATRHQRETLARVNALRETVGRELAAARQELAALAEERDTARELAQSLGDGVRDQELWRRNAEKERKTLSAKLASLETRIASLTEERDVARRAEKGLRWRLEQAEQKLASANARKGAEPQRDASLREEDLPGKVRNWAAGQAEAVEKVLAKAGVRLEQLLARVDDDSHEGVGGPLMPAGPDDVEVASLDAAPGDTARGQALRQVMAALPLATPLDGYRVMSDFGVRSDPIRKRRAMHEGIDLSAGRGEQVLATQAGRVIQAGRDGAYGIVVVIDHGMGITTRYAHLKRTLVRRGDRVEARRPIGIIGSSGRSTGRHLHYEIRLDDKPLNPAPFLEARKRFGSVLKG
jgi:murein DD-endopeptidase MepM/ murein hydrolase activator NlpD